MKPIRAPSYLRALAIQLAVIAGAGVVFALAPARDLPEAKDAPKPEDHSPGKVEPAERVVVVKVERVSPDGKKFIPLPPTKRSPELLASAAPPERIPEFVEMPKAGKKSDQPPEPKREPPSETAKNSAREDPTKSELRSAAERADATKSAFRSPPQAAEIADVSGVPLRVLVPSSPADLERYLNRSHSCLLISRLTGDRADVVESLDVAGGRTQPSTRPPCSGVPRVIRDHALIAALGDPIARTRRTHTAAATGELVMQIVLPATLVGAAENAAKKRLGSAAPKELARRAAAAGYEIRCFAKTDGTLACI